MSLFTTLKQRIFSLGTAESEAPATSATPVTPLAAVEASAPGEPVDIEAALSKLAATRDEKLDWRRSIADLMKLLEMDSSYGARKELALELGYRQAEIDSKGSAEMNIWLHREVMRRLAEDGAKVPVDGLG